MKKKIGKKTILLNLTNNQREKISIIGQKGENRARWDFRKKLKKYH
jgi:Spy/CpxP family protein refolding chaperone